MTSPAAHPSNAPKALVIGSNRGLGLALVKQLDEEGYEVYGTIRSTEPPTPSPFPSGTHIVLGVDLAKPGAGADALAEAVGEVKFDLVLFVAGYFKTDTLETLNWEEQITMYSTCALAPPFLAAKLAANHNFAPSAKLLLVTTEGGSIALRTQDEGGSNYAHHASKAAQNMVGRLLSLDLGPKGVTVVNIHPGFMKTDMTKGVGFDEFYESGGAVEPEEAARSLLAFAATVTKEHNGQFWAPRGPADVGQAENVLGPDLPTPLQLPW